MPEIRFPYGTDHLTVNIPEQRFGGVLQAHALEAAEHKSQTQLVQEALEHPIGSPRLCELARDKQKIVIIASDHTRPVPSKIIAPLMLQEIRRSNPTADITFLVSTGCHRKTTKEELVSKFGEQIVRDEKIYIHDCDDAQMLVPVGTLPSGGALVLNRLAMEADLLVSEGFIEPHFFAGFSGGRKSVLPGIAARETVIYNHNAAFINHPCARTGVLEGNPIHADMQYAARAAKLAFVCNVVLNAEKQVIHAVAGDMEQAHAAGCAFLSSRCQTDRMPSDIVITTNGGYPLDQNIYQAVKGMTAAEATVNPGGVIIMLAKSNDGHGGASFYKTFCEHSDLQALMDTFLATPPEQTIIDQWQSQIFARVLLRAQVIYVSDAPDEMVRNLHMIPAHSLQDAIRQADVLLEQRGIRNARILAIPDGVSVMVR